jgi:hypothetical protein
MTFDRYYKMKQAEASLGDCSFTIYLNDTEKDLIEKISSDHTFLELLGMIQERKKIYLPSPPHSFAIKREVESKNVMKKITGKSSTDVEMINIMMADTIGASTYRSFYKHGRMDLWIVPPITEADKTRVFGTSLEILYKRANIPTTTLLPVLSSLFNIVNDGGLTEVGIFRLSGSVKEGETLRKAINDGKAVNTTNVILAASLIKEFLRNMPEALISGIYYEQIKELFSDNGTNLLYY